mmetsp:Transcript_11674/g.33197  ORF Transcript_11674/g.33197 Transcript_11674/m.33197 type:complete len:240 (+) Transcript_11674:610-1329(+)
MILVDLLPHAAVAQHGDDAGVAMRPAQRGQVGHAAHPLRRHEADAGDGQPEDGRHPQVGEGGHGGVAVLLSGLAELVGQGHEEAAGLPGDLRPQIQDLLLDGHLPNGGEEGRSELQLLLLIRTIVVVVVGYSHNAAGQDPFQRLEGLEPKAPHLRIFPLHEIVLNVAQDRFQLLDSANDDGRFGKVGIERGEGGGGGGGGCTIAISSIALVDSGGGSSSLGDRLVSTTTTIIISATPTY